MKKIGIFIFLLTIASCQSQTNQKLQPNFIIIMADDLGYGDLSCYGNQQFQTPHIDRLAENGIRFTNFYSNGTVCSPTRAALLSGQYQQRSGIEGVVTAANHRDTGLPLETVTLAEALQKLDYRTAVFGKWHLGYDTLFNPLNQGFDEFAGYVSGNVDYQSHIDQSGHADWWQNKMLKDESGYSTQLITNHSLNFIEKNADKPFLLYVAHEAPHYPYQGPNDPADRTIDGEFPILGSRQDRQNAYQEMVWAMDEGIGQIVEKLADKDILKNTFIFFCSDNGATKEGSNGDLRGLKGSLWEGGIRVPAIAYWQGTIKPGISDELMLSMDVFPTLMNFTNSNVTSLDFDGIDFSKLLLDQENLTDRTVFWRYGQKKAVRQGTWKLVQDQEQHFYLFNLKNDPREQNDLKTEQTERFNGLKEKLKSWEKKMDQYERRS